MIKSWFGISVGLVSLLAAFACGPQQIYGDDTGASGSPADSEGLGTVGEPCAPNGNFACAGRNQRTQLLCKDSAWEVHAQCAAAERCDSSVANAGACEPLVSECADKSPGDGVCRGLRRFDCGIDRVSEEKAETCDTICVEQDGVAKCETCAEGSFVENAATCTAWTSCSWEMGGLAQPGTATTDAVCGAPSEYRQFGTGGFDYAHALAVDAEGNAFVAGSTEGALDGTNAGDWDAYVRKYAADGSVLWTRQFGTANYDIARAVAMDSEGNAFVAGYTEGVLDGTSAGGADAYVRKYAPDGSVLWTRQFGTVSGDSASALAVDAEGNVFVAGATSGALDGTNAGFGDAYVRKYDADGNALWIRQFGTASSDSAQALAVDTEGNAFVAGSTLGALDGTSAGSNDAFVRKYAADGSVLWTRQFGTVNSDIANAIAVDAEGNAFVAGNTQGELEGTSAGSGDAFVRKYAADGSVLWTRQFGTDSYDSASAIAVDAEGNAFVTGNTEGALDGTNAGNDDAYVRKYAADGSVLWTRQFGTASLDTAWALAVDVEGNSFVAGNTLGALAGPNAGNADAFVRKIPH